MKSFGRRDVSAWQGVISSALVGGVGVLLFVLLLPISNAAARCICTSQTCVIIGLLLVNSARTRRQVRRISSTGQRLIEKGRNELGHMTMRFKCSELARSGLRVMFQEEVKLLAELAKQLTEAVEQGVSLPSVFSAIRQTEYNLLPTKAALQIFSRTLLAQMRQSTIESIRDTSIIVVLWKLRMVDGVQRLVRCFAVEMDGDNTPVVDGLRTSRAVTESNATPETVLLNLNGGSGYFVADIERETENCRHLGLFADWPETPMAQAAIKGAFCYKILDPSDGKPAAVFSVYASTFDVFDDKLSFFRDVVLPTAEDWMSHFPRECLRLSLFKIFEKCSESATIERG